MCAQAKDVLFCIRAYNDLDIQMSLIREFARDENYAVRVVFYGCDGFITHHTAHEAIPYMKDTYGVSFESLYDNRHCPLWLKALYTVQAKVRPLRSRFTGFPFAHILKILDVGLGMLMKPGLKARASWLLNAAQTYNPAVAFSDEVLFQPGRAPFIDTAFPDFAQRGAAIYTILTGHRVYTDVYPTGAPDEKPPYTPSLSRAYLVPSAHNAAIYKQLFPQENIVVSGNLRMDRDWIKTLHAQGIVAKADLPERSVKIVMMLSKMNYGVEADNIKDTIRTLGHMEGVALAIKPHTRGMKFDFMGADEIGDAVIVGDVPSAALIEWGDVILMTGSSIVFHAMILDKVAGFLKYCQKLETIFDDGKACIAFESLDHLKTYIQDYVQNGKPEVSAEDKASYAAFTKHEIHGDVEGGQTARHCKALIEAALPD